MNQWLFPVRFYQNLYFWSIVTVFLFQNAKILKYVSAMNVNQWKKAMILSLKNVIVFRMELANLIYNAVPLNSSKALLSVIQT